MSYNSDRISIVTNLFPPKSRRSMFKSSSSINTDETRSVENDFDLPKWPRCSFFGIFDGHNGLACAEFLRDNLHKYIIRDSHFPNDPRRAIRNGIEQADKDFLSQAYDQEKQILHDISGSSLSICLIVDTTIYTANVGDCRILLSQNEHILQLS